MSPTTIILLGAFAGLTIYLGLPLAFFKKASPTFKSFASMLAAGVLVFLFFDVIAKASEPIDAALETFHAKHIGTITVLAEVLLVIVGFGIGLLGLVYFNKYVIARYKKPASVAPVERVPEPVLAKIDGGIEPVALGATTATTVITQSPAITSSLPSSKTLAMMIAIGIGLHNFSEGLAIGQSAAAGAISLATVLIIGFGLHNMTEGFGIAGPLTTESVSWKFVGLAGLIGGGPTFLGTLLGMVYQSDYLFILFLALAAGSILYVIVELLAVAKRNTKPEVIMWGLFTGFLLGYLTDLLLTFAGA